MPCNRKFAPSQYWSHCGERSNEGGAALCTDCGGSLKIADGEPQLVQFLVGPGVYKETFGLDDKFIVVRRDGSNMPGGKHEHCVYFVLDLVHDKFAKVALEAYAAACEAEMPDFAAGIRRSIT